MLRRGSARMLGLRLVRLESLDMGVSDASTTDRLSGGEEIEMEHAELMWRLIGAGFVGADGVGVGIGGGQAGQRRNSEVVPRMTITGSLRFSIS